MLNELVVFDSDDVIGIYRWAFFLNTVYEILRVFLKSGNILKNFNLGIIRYSSFMMLPNLSFSAEISSKIICPM